MLQPTTDEFGADDPPAQSVTADELMPAVYDELRRLAGSHLAGDQGRGHVTLQPTSLIHEVYLRLTERGLRFASRRHFFFVASRAMRDILIERARLLRVKAKKSDQANVADWLDTPGGDPATQLDLLALDEAMQALEKADEELAELVTLRFFAGLSVEESAEVVGRSERTVRREWAFARGWLRRYLEG